MEQGTTNINGPHQGGWVELDSGESWFVHFQDRLAYGRVVHLNPVRWVDGWPEMGVDLDGNGVGEPVATYDKPNVGRTYPTAAPTTTDEFDQTLNLTWQWQAMPRTDWASLDDRPGWLRLRAVPRPPGNFTAVPNQLLQKFPAPEFTATTRIELPAGATTVEAGLMVMGMEYAGLMVSPNGDGLKIERITSSGGGLDGDEHHVEADATVERRTAWLRVRVDEPAQCRFSYSSDGRHFQPLGDTFEARPGRWIGAKVGVVATGQDGFADLDWFRIE
jgi:beta-xylosidase